MKMMETILYQCFLMILHNETTSNRLSPCSYCVSFFEKSEHPEDDRYGSTAAYDLKLFQVFARDFMV